MGIVPTFPKVSAVTLYAISLILLGSKTSCSIGKIIHSFKTQRKRRAFQFQRYISLINEIFSFTSSSIQAFNNGIR